MDQQEYIDLTPLLKHDYNFKVLLHPEVEELLKTSFHMSDASFFRGVIAESVESFIRTFFSTSEWVFKQPVNAFDAYAVTLTNGEALVGVLHLHRFDRTLVIKNQRQGDLPENYVDRMVIEIASLIDQESNTP